jgi:hypothetical protein
MSVIQITPDPAIWTYQNSNSDPADNNPGVWSTYADRDGTTAWIFEGFGGGWGRVNLSDGSFLAQDTFFGQPDRGNSTGPFWFINWMPNYYQTFFTQDPVDATTYFTSIQGLANSGFAQNTYLFKFQLGSGSSGNLLNGYCTDAVTYFDIFAAATAWTNFDPIDTCLVHTGGKTYCAIINFNVSGFLGNRAGIMVVDTSTMTVAATYQVPNSTPAPNGYCVFADKNNVLWGGFMNAVTGDALMVSWTPGGGFNTHTIPYAVHGLPILTDTQMAVMGYLPQTNSVFLADVAFPTASQGMANVSTVSMDTWAQTHFIDNAPVDGLGGTYFHTAGASSYPASACAGQSMDSLNASNLAFVVEGGLGVLGQVGGVVNIIDPTTMEVISTQNTRAVINASSASIPIATKDVVHYAGGVDGDPLQYPPFSGLAWSPTAGKVIVAYGDLQSGLGSAAYIVGISGPTPPATGTTASISRVILVGNADVHAPMPTVPKR